MQANPLFPVVELVKNAPLPYKSVWPSHGVKAGLEREPLSPNVDAHPTTGGQAAHGCLSAARPNTQWGEHKEPCSAVMQYSWWGREPSS